MKRHYINKLKMVSGAALLAPAIAFAFDSGSTGVDGVFNPTVNTQLELPPTGVFNFSSVNVPVGVTVTFKKNATNTPVVILSSTNITISGAINLSGGASTTTGAAGNGNLGDDGLPGISGVGGFAGGIGGKAGNLSGGAGLGPGGGMPGKVLYSGSYPTGGGGGGFNGAGANNNCYPSCASGMGGASYGSSLLLPLIGGSGGGGGFGGGNYGGSGGGGGGGAILLAASSTVTVAGSIVANGGSSGSTNSGGNIAGSSGGGGSGGAIRIIAGTIAGNGTISAGGGGVGETYIGYNGGYGAAGRIRLEADSINRTAATTPAYTVAAPGPVFVAGLPTLRIESVAGVAAPASPTGNADITLPSTTVNPAVIVFSTTNVPVGNTVKLVVVGSTGDAITVVSPALTGTTQSATTSASVTLPNGPSTLQAQTTYTIVASLGDMMRNFAGNERVESVELVAGMDGKSKTNLITVSGKRYEASPEALVVLSSTPAFNAQGS